MDQSNSTILSIKNRHYAQEYCKFDLKLKNIKINEKNELINKTKEKIDEKMNQLTKEEILFYQQTSRACLVKMIDELHKTENQMYEKLFEVLDNLKKQNNSEKENQMYRDCEFNKKIRIESNQRSIKVLKKQQAIDLDNSLSIENKTINQTNWPKSSTIDQQNIELTYRDFNYKNSIDSNRLKKRISKNAKSKQQRSDELFKMAFANAKAIQMNTTNLKDAIKLEDEFNITIKNHRR